MLIISDLIKFPRPSFRLRSKLKDEQRRAVDNQRGPYDHGYEAACHEVPPRSATSFRTAANRQL